jgi:prolipoprotein diacylglyceryl transferase
MMLLASIPSPAHNTIDIGPLTIHYYGIMIGLGVLVAALVVERRYARSGADPSILESIILWTVGIGFAGARLAYVSTHTSRFVGRWWSVFFIWEGGLALYGGLTAGAITALYLLRKRGGDIAAFTDAGAIGIPLAQAIGRWGNYFNQELFGTPTTLPWGVEIAPIHRPAQYADAATFHPTFLYESLWNLVIVVPVILVLERRGKLAKGAAFPVYLVLYGIGRFLMELMRTDTTFRLLGLSRNGWVSLGAVAAGAVLYAVITRRSRRGAASDPAAGELEWLEPT